MPGIVGHTTIAKYLMTKGVNVDLQDLEGTNALMCAAVNGHERLVKLLVEKGRARLDLQSDMRATALSLATEYKHTTIAKYLVEKGASTTNVNHQNQECLTKKT